MSEDVATYGDGPEGQQSAYFEALCFNGHQFTAGSNETLTCPICSSQSVQIYLALPPEPFALITAGARDWRAATAALEDFAGMVGGCSIALGLQRWLGETYRALVGQAVWDFALACRPPHWEDIEVTVTREQRRVSLSEAELAAAAIDMAEIELQIAANDDARKAAMAEFKAIDEGLHKRLHRVGSDVRDGELRMVPINILRNYTLGLLQRVVGTTGEIIEERALSAEERQRALFPDNRNGKEKKRRRSKGARDPEPPPTDQDEPEAHPGDLSAL